MPKRPVSITVIAWIIIVINVLSLVGAGLSLSDPAAQEMMAQSSIPVPAQYALLFVGLALSIACAAFMLRAANWARWTYIGWSTFSMLVAIATSTDRSWLLPGIIIYAIFIFILVRPAATAYFSRTAEPAID